MPSASTFNGADQDWHYALSWMACDYIAERFGEARLWDLIDAFSRGEGGAGEARQDEVLRDVIGFGPDVLAGHARDRIREIYR
ncbi:MAG: hypothetical protein EOO74_08470 [Myxococcales bacterium]|nr:MAG: hypothetical protein EOO74_08470 [Myxococcales bacterium]